MPDDSASGERPESSLTVIIAFLSLLVALALAFTLTLRLRLALTRHFRLTRSDIRSRLLAL